MASSSGSGILKLLSLCYTQPFLGYVFYLLQEISSSFMPFAQESQNIPGSILAQVPPRFACIARYSLYFLSLLEHPLWLSDGDSGGPYF